MQWLKTAKISYSSKFADLNLPISLTVTTQSHGVSPREGEINVHLFMGGRMHGGRDLWRPPLHATSVALDNSGGTSQI
jgi:hypothetical protein